MIRVGFTGTRHGMTYQQITMVTSILSTWKRRFENCTIHHGDCLGADVNVHSISRELGFSVVTHPPDSDRLRAWCASDEEWPTKPYLVRNVDIVDNSDRVIGTPWGETEILKSGTWHALRYAKKSGKRVYVVWGSGRLERFNCR